MNGKIYVRKMSGESGFDAFGNPVASPSEWYNPIDCNIETLTDTRLGVYEDGNYRAASYVVLLEADALPCRKADIVRLERYGECLGEFRVASVDSLLGMGRIRITV